MNITIVVDRYYPHVGGVEQYIRGLSGQLTEDGHQVTIITGAAADAPGAQITPEGSIIRTPLLGNASADPQAVLDRAPELAKTIATMSPDVVYANNHASLGAISATQMIGVPVVYGCHGWGLICPSRIKLLKHSGEICKAETSVSACVKCYSSSSVPVKVKIPGLVKQAARVHRYIGYLDVLNSADARIGVSRLAASMFGEKSISYAVHPGIDTETYRKVDVERFRSKFKIEGDYVLVPGRMNPIKGQMDALKAVEECELDLTVVFAGNVDLNPLASNELGPYGRAVQERAGGLGMREKAVFTGMLSQQEMVEAFSGASATVVPSVWAEPFGYVAAESMSCETPVIITSNSGAAELVDDEVGQKVPRNDHHAIARALERVVPDSEKLGRTARHRVQEQLTWPTVARRIVEIFEMVQQRGYGQRNAAA